MTSPWNTFASQPGSGSAAYPTQDARFLPAPSGYPATPAPSAYAAMPAPSGYAAMPAPSGYLATPAPSGAATQTLPPRGQYSTTQTLPPQVQYAPTQMIAAPQFPPPPQYGFGPYPGQQPPRPNRTGLIVSLVVVAVLLIGGGVAAFFLLNKSDEAVGPTGPGTAATAAPTSASSGPTISTMGSQTTATATSASPHSSSAPHTTSHGTSTGDVPQTGNGDLATAETLIDTWVDFVNDGDMDTASMLVCEAQRADFRDSEPPAGTLEVLDVAADGDNVMVSLGTAGSSAASDEYVLTMRPTNTGYFLICDQPLSDADMNW